LGYGLYAGFGGVEENLLKAVSEIKIIETNQALSVENGPINVGGNAKIRGQCLDRSSIKLSYGDIIGQVGIIRTNNTG
jgi:hypothetical protein